MSYREIENYLKSVERHLKVGRWRRRAIVSELGDHLAERMADLMGEGCDESEATALALGEFGEPVRLAAEFVGLSRELRRRWVMRLTAGTFAAAVVVLMIGLSLWPDGPVSSVVRRAGAQDPQDPFAGGEAVPVSIDENNAATERKLGERIEAIFLETPLGEVIDHVSDVAEIQVYVDEAGLEGVGVSLDMPINLHLKRVRIDMILELVLAQAGQLGYVVRDGIVMISEKSRLENRTEVRVYNSRDVLALGVPARLHGGGPYGVGGGPYGGSGYGEADDYGIGGFPGGGEAGYPGGLGGADAGGEGGYPGGPGAAGAGGEGNGGGEFGDSYGSGFGGSSDGGMSGMMGGGAGRPYRPTVASSRQAAQLIAIIEQTIEPESWTSMGGYGTVAEYGGLLVVNHNVRVQQRVDELLKMLREAATSK